MLHKEIIATPNRLFAVYAAIILIVYSPIFLPYAFVDDYTQLYEHLAGQSEIVLRGTIADGRPFQYPLLFSAIPGIQWLPLVRFAGVLGIFLIACILNRMLVSAMVSPGFASWLPIFTVLLPPFQVWGAWAICYNFPYSAISALLAHWFLGRQTNRQPWLSVILLSISLGIYQPGAMFFWVATAIGLVASRGPFRWKALLAPFSVAATALFLNYAALRVLPLLIYGSSAARSRTELTHDPIDKIVWFFRSPILDGLNFPIVVPSVILALATGSVLAIGLALWCRARGAFASRLAVALCLIPLSYLPNLASSDNWSAYRTQAALAALLLLYLGLALFSIAARVRLLTAKLLRYATSASLIGFALLAFGQILFTFSLPSIIEYDSLRSRLISPDMANVSELSFVMPKNIWSIAPLVRYDEFGHLSLSATWVPVPMTRLIFREARIDSTIDIKVYEAQPAQVANSATSRTIDLSKMFGNWHLTYEEELRYMTGQPLTR